MFSYPSPDDTSLLSTAKWVIIFAGIILALALSFLLANTFPYLGFHAGRYILGKRTDWSHPGALVTGFIGFIFYSGLCGFGPDGPAKLNYFVVNVPFGVAFATGLALVLFSVGVGVGRVLGLVEVEGGLGRVIKEKNLRLS